MGSSYATQCRVHSVCAILVAVHPKLDLLGKRACTSLHVPVPSLLSLLLCTLYPLSTFAFIVVVTLAFVRDVGGFE